MLAPKLVKRHLDATFDPHFIRLHICPSWYKLFNPHDSMNAYWPYNRQRSILVPLLGPTKICLIWHKVSCSIISSFKTQIRLIRHQLAFYGTNLPRTAYNSPSMANRFAFHSRYIPSTVNNCLSLQHIYLLQHKYASHSKQLPPMSHIRLPHNNRLLRYISRTYDTNLSSRHISASYGT